MSFTLREGTFVDLARWYGRRVPVRSEILRVLVSVSRIENSTNPFIRLLTSNLDSSVDVIEFSWKAAFLKRYDVFHVHWPDHLLIGRSLSLQIVKPLLFLGLLARLRLGRTPIVWTMHNLTPHKKMTRLQLYCYARFEAQVSSIVAMNSHGVERLDVPVSVIPHGHYRDWYDSGISGQRKSKHVLFFGTIQPYKQADTLVWAFSNMQDESATLSVVGRCDDKSIRNRLRGLAREDERISLNLAFVDDSQLARELSECTLVVLPYAEMYNSGAVLLALSLDRPVLVPSTQANKELQLEIGEEWIMLYNGSIAAADISLALKRAMTPPANRRVDLSGRDWERIASLYRTVYVDSVEKRKGCHHG
jgi:beta-1,4-mannosyltransferase